MAMDNRQKTLLGVLVVLVLGMGSWFVFLRDSGPATAANTGPKERVVKVRDTKKDSGPVRTVRKKEAPETAVVEKDERRERDPAEREKADRKKRDAKKTQEKKAKKIAPAA